MAAKRPDEDAAWAALDLELDRWAEAGRVASLWWRDDDAAALNAALERLLDLSAEAAVPLALAVVPGLMSPQLPTCLATAEEVCVLQHGWRHVDHAGPGEGAWELGDHRPRAQVDEELEAGRRRLADAFDARFLPILVPPWNRISLAVTAGLPALGFRGFSTFGARPPQAVSGLVQVNAHCDPISWKRGRRFAGTGRALDDLVRHLAARRTGAADPAEPTGLVTHHLAMDGPAWAFVGALLHRTRGHPAALWLGAPDAFRP